MGGAADRATPIEEEVIAARRARAQRPDPLLGTLMEGRYEILKRIGAGGMGVVYRARQAAMDRIVAVKVLIRSVAANETNVKRFQLEARAASRLDHPNTITIHDFGQTRDGTLYIVMEFLEGQALEAVISANKTLDPRRVVDIMSQVCGSLAEAHAQGVIHRDLKPDNIFLVDRFDRPDFVKVLDFGVAKLKDPDTRGDAATLTQAGMIFGTPKYMSPEQAQSLELNATSDIYALGVMMYEMLAGRAPFVGEVPLNILIQHVHNDPEPLSEVVDGDVPPALEAVVMRTLAKDPALRPQSADELRTELLAAYETFASGPWRGAGGSGPGLGLSGTATRVSPARQGTTGRAKGVGADAAVTEGAAWDFAGEQPEDPAPQSAKPGAGRWLGLAAVLVFLLLVGVVAVLGAIRRGGGGSDGGAAGRLTPVAAKVDAGRPDQGAGALASAGLGDAGAALDGSSDGGKLAAAEADTGRSARTASGRRPGRTGGRRQPTGGRKPPPAAQGSGGDTQAESKRITLRLRSTPVGAQVYLNGREFVGLTPTSVRRPRNLIPVTLHFRKGGFRETKLPVTFLADGTHHVTLARAAPARPADPPSGTSGGGRQPPRPPEPPPPTDQGGPFRKFGDFRPIEFKD